MSSITMRSPRVIRVTTLAVEPSTLARPSRVVSDSKVNQAARRPLSMLAEARASQR